MTKVCLNKSVQMVKQMTLISQARSLTFYPCVAHQFGTVSLYLIRRNLFKTAIVKQAFVARLQQFFGFHTLKLT